MRTFKFMGVVVLMMAFILMISNTTVMAQNTDKTEKKKCSIKCDSKASCTAAARKDCAQASKCCPTDKSKCCPGDKSKGCPGTGAQCSVKHDGKKCGEVDKSKCCPKSSDKVKSIKVEKKKTDSSI